MRAFHLLKISVPLPGLAEPEEGWRTTFTRDLAATGAYHEITREGLLVRLPAGDRDEGSPEGANAAVPYTGDLRFDAGVPGGAGATFAARLDEGQVLWMERLDYERFRGQARLYYSEGRPIVLTDEEYRERRRADHDEALTEDHGVEALSPRAASDGGGIGVETREGARFVIVPEDDLPLPKPGDEVRLYLTPGRAHDAPGDVVGVDLNGEFVYYEPAEAHARRRAARPADNPDAPDLRAMRQWLELISPGGLSPRGFAAIAAYEGTIVFPNLAGAERRAERMHEVHEDAHRQSRRALASRLMEHALNLSHDTTSIRHPAARHSSDTAALGEREGEGRPVDPWTGRPLDEGNPLSE